MNAELPYAGYRLFARSDGEGPALLLIHGFPTSSRDWDPLWPVLSRRWSLHAIDMLGFGLSDKPSDFAYSVSASADQWEALCSARGLGSVHVLAHDYGDTVAQELLARQIDGRLPFAIRSIAFLNGGLFAEATHPLRVQRWLLGPFGPWIARLSSERTFVSGMRRICARVPDTAELHEHWQLLVRAGGRRVLPKLIRYIRERSEQRERWVGALQRAGIPICLIDGVEDPVSGADTVRRWRELLPQAPAHELTGVGHYPQWEAPGAVLAAFEAFHRGVTV
ncbi:alpha/beta fold hydrolase [Arenimonas sp.]|uniref:alpha/beta fold hydrolase n=1 Tax=Arenimonas sp. TaxID=1872635 RepID=UPI0039E3D5A7